MYLAVKQTTVTKLHHSFYFCNSYLSPYARKKSKCNQGNSTKYAFCCV